MFYQYGILLFTIVSVTTALPADTSCSCQRNMAPVCGSDGTTYNNECLFNCARFVNTELTIQNYGRCGEQECFCNYNYNPVCGTDGRTYGNVCSLRCLKKKTPQLDVKHTGKCNTPKRMYDDVTREEEDKETRAESPKKFTKVANHNTVNVAQVPDIKNCNCITKLIPVCGTNGLTYINPCHLNCASVMKGGGIQVFRWGSCKSMTYGSQDRCTSCPLRGDPVCGANGVTYANACLMRCVGVETGRPGVCAHNVHPLQAQMRQTQVHNV